jgi:lysylphosphatidylglycerol synthetase-like protein (DUF2156 family)
MPAQPIQSSEPKRDGPAESPSRLLSFCLLTALVLGAALALTTLGERVSTQVSILTSPENALPVVAAVLAVWLLLAYPLWPGSLLGRGKPLERFGPWLLLRAAEVGILMAIALPVLLVAAVFSRLPLHHAVQLVPGLLGTAAAAIAYRLVHQTCREGFRSVALVDAMLFLFAPIVVGYVVLEFYATSISWGWLISPLALACHVSVSGLDPLGANALIGIVGYGALSALGFALVLPFARWCRDNDRQQSHRRTWS